MELAAIDWSNVAGEAAAIVAILVGALIVGRLVRWLIKLVMGRLLAPSTNRHLARWRQRTPDALLRTGEGWSLRAEARVNTLIGVFRGIGVVIVWIVALAWIFQILGVDLGPLFASAGIAGVALGFGAQNMVRDFLSGYFMVAEDQFGVGDVVDLSSEVAGTVERVSLRSTSVRDIDGTLWHIPNGQITRVGNKSQEFARALVDIEFHIEADYEVAREVITSTARTLAADPEWRREILESPEVLGIEQFTPGGYVVRVALKTRPASQWGVMRELRIRLKSAFPEAGLVLPEEHPQLWIYRGDDVLPSASRRSSQSHRPGARRPEAAEVAERDEHPVRGDAPDA